MRVFESPSENCRTYSIPGPLGARLPRRSGWGTRPSVELGMDLVDELARASHVARSAATRGFGKGREKVVDRNPARAADGPEPLDEPQAIGEGVLVRVGNPELGRGGDIAHESARPLPKRRLGTEAAQSVGRGDQEALGAVPVPALQRRAALLDEARGFRVGRLRRVELVLDPREESFDLRVGGAAAGGAHAASAGGVGRAGPLLRTAGSRA